METRSSLETALEAARPRLSRLLDFYRVPPDDAHGLLEDLAAVAAYRLPGLADPERWLSLNLQARCLLYWRRRCLADENTRISIRAGELAFLAVALGLTPEEIEVETGEPVQEVRRTLYRVLWRGLRSFLGEEVPPHDGGSEL